MVSLSVRTPVVETMAVLCCSAGMTFPLSDHLPVGVSSVNRSMAIATPVMRTNGTMKETRHATCGVRPRLCTLVTFVSEQADDIRPGRLQRVIYGRHHEVRDATTRVTPATDQRIRRANDVSVEEASSPHLAGHKCASENTNEEPDGIQTSGIMCCASQSRWNSTN